jgi:hypothetical protein
LDVKAQSNGDGISITSTSDFSPAINFHEGTTLAAQIGVAIDGGDFVSTSTAHDFVINQYTSNDMVFATNDTERMRIVTGGNVGIGVAAPLGNLHLKATEAEFIIEDTGATSTSKIWQTALANDKCYFQVRNDANTDEGHAGGNETMVFDMTNSNVGIGVAAPSAKLDIQSSELSSTPMLQLNCTESDIDAGNIFMKIFASVDADIHDNSAVVRLITIYDGGGEIGYFTTASNGNVNTAWTNVSDIRLKKDIKDTSLEGLKIINNIKVRDFKWNKERKNVEGKQIIGGFVADELYEAYPLATTGTPGAKKEDGSIDPMGVTDGNLISVLLKAVQELSAKVTALENA